MGVAMLLNALGGRRKPAEHRCNPYEALVRRGSS
jgi:hypothetical protein